MTDDAMVLAIFWIVNSVHVLRSFTLEQLHHHFVEQIFQQDNHIRVGEWAGLSFNLFQGAFTPLLVTGAMLTVIASLVGFLAVFSTFGLRLYPSYS